MGTNSSSPDFEALIQAGVYDPNAEDAEDRKALIEYLTELGAETAEIISAKEPLWGLAAVISRRESWLYSVRELAEKMDLDVEDVANAYTAVGLLFNDLDEKHFTDEDLQMIKNIGELESTLHMERNDLSELMRVFGLSLARMADAFVAVYTQGPVKRLADQNLSQLEKAKITIELMEGGRDLPAAQVVGVQLGHHVNQAFFRQAEAQVSAQQPGQLQLAVGFVDIAGFTSMSSASSPSELMSLISYFENEALRIVTQYDGRIVKTIGDEVMFSVNNVAQGCRIALDLCETFSKEGISPHGSLTYGEVVSHRGDFYGEVVNLAARLAGISIEKEILVSSSVAEFLEGDSCFNFLPAGRRIVRGFAEPVVVYTLERV